jgi:type II secretory pathway pseudopilin PulG
MQLRRAALGFTLTELAVVFTIVALLIGGAILTLNAQVEQRNHDETMRRLNAAAEAVLAFAIVRRRLPCPALDGATGDEAQAGGGACTTWGSAAPAGPHGGLLPARTIGFQPTDASGYALDVWGNRIRYAVANAITGCTGSPATPHFTSELNLKANGVSCRPNDLDICAPTGTTTTCTAANRVASTETIAFIVLSTGKNGALTATYGPHESANVDGTAAFISRTPSSAEANNGAFDDLMVMVPVGAIYAKLIAAGVLP